ncbi:membrane protein insertion efficiency factor YidD [uncultured Dokdonia sp.]|uniref:membrane protein insertion efficiency factor YidD n=1 Tax=uncultured Dokdonia sp. TaxID=575653 RepID=UPI002636EA52|nr:membrane protein insertion efficiency factor YidD [uncultured Dokdonia sp.]
MRYLLLITIRLYWKLIPASRRKRCLFKESCSHYVYNITKAKGFITGVSALHYRYKHCRSGYTILQVPSQKILVSSNNIVFQEEEIHPRLLNNHEPLQNERL